MSEKEQNISNSFLEDLLFGGKENYDIVNIRELSVLDIAARMQ